MTIEMRAAAVGHLHRLFIDGAVSGLADDRLLERFLTSHAGDAFDALVARHGPMVLRVCLDVLRDPNDAEDAFQATFLVLVKKARALRGHANLGGWLHRVAYRVAIQANAAAVRRRAQERKAGEMTATTGGRNLDIPDEFITALHEEIARLPEQTRRAVVLCDLQGLLQAEAASSLRLSERTLRRRLADGRRRLRNRLDRRGLAWGEGLLIHARFRDATTAVPPAWREAAVRTALDGLGATALPGSASVAARSLAHDVLRTSLVPRLAATSTALLGAGLVAWAASWALVRGGDEPSGSATTVAMAPQPQPPPGDNREATQLSGRVLDPDGKPIGRAHVAVQVIRGFQPSDRGLRPAPRVLGQTETDARGEFRLAIPRLSSTTSYDPVVIASAPSYGIDGRSIGADDRNPGVTIVLSPEQFISRRLVDHEGRPAAGVVVRVRSLFSFLRGTAESFSAVEAPEPPSFWPKPVTTDAEGRFVIRGLGTSTRARLAISDDRFAPWVAEGVEPVADPRQEATWALTPARPVTIRVVHADDRRPVPGAQVVVMARRRGPTGVVASQDHGRTDDQGLFRTVPSAGDRLGVGVIPPDGEPYLMTQLNAAWPEAPAAQEFLVAVRRGILIRGTVTEAPSGKPVGGARAFFVQQFADNPHYLGDFQRPLHGFQQDAISAPDGRFALAIPPGPGALLVQAPTPEYLHEEINQGQLKTIGAEWRHYPDGLVPLDLAPGSEAREVPIRLRRGVTLKGRAVRPDGQAVNSGVLFCRSYVPFSYNSVDSNYNGATLRIRDGHFELPGCDPERPSTVYFLDVNEQLGAVAELHANKENSEPVTVKLSPCGTATVRFVTAEGKPIEGFQPQPEVIVTPGTHDVSDATKNVPFADTVLTYNLDRARYNGLRTDAQGRCTLPSLIPGARYWLNGREFIPEPARAIDLGDIKVQEVPRPASGPPAATRGGAA